jgi:hypothetical protein
MGVVRVDVDRNGAVAYVPLRKTVWYEPRVFATFNQISTEELLAVFQARAFGVQTGPSAIAIESDPFSVAAVLPSARPFDVPSETVPVYVAGCPCPDASPAVVALCASFSRQ